MLIFAREASYSPRLRFERVARETGAVDPGRRGWLAGFAAAAALAALGGRAQGLRAQPGAARMQPVGVIGAGHIGGTIGGLWVQAGHPVLFSSRHPDELRPLAQAGSVAQAIAFADVVFLAVPYKALPEIARDYGRALSGKVVIDATNAFRERDGNAVRWRCVTASASRPRDSCPAPGVVRAFNFMAAAAFASESHHAGEPVAVPIAGDDPQALRVAKQLVRDAGFEPVVVGGRASADSFAPGGPLFHQIGSAQAMRERIARLPNPAGAR